MCSASAWADCSRVIVVPAAPTGFNVKVVDDLVTGVYPDWLRDVGRRAGCQFQFPVMPRARADSMLFVSNQSDMLLPASQNAERDQKAQFVHVVNLTPSLITLHGLPNVPRDVRALLGRTNMRAALVRSYSWGDEYEALVRELMAENRVDFVNDLETIGRMLRIGRVDFTILPPTLLYSALQIASAGIQTGEFRYTALAGLPRSKVGAYLSRQTLSTTDLDLLSSQMLKTSKDGSLRAYFEKYYPQDVVAADISPN
ncbi:transporter substrate-binding domain-containing protein [Rhodoferax saidenbachensis]|uniref:Polar amino acid transport system substrate-binding protein n=1 Tax=Rhodoferax saidenbachensis TaxID=1484693 RepID=A0ABU1ZQ22_9BURK|nr:transporter substrate-binding domain-containing protein [Rhodoferax saidenbachensis]MDR7307627.1 polar amino acid transport system substrate-binding protein [Rhodoferax saidenbachensis]